MNIKQILEAKAKSAIVAAGFPEDTNPAVAASAKANFGDYQINAAMGLGKKQKMNPRDVASKIIEHLDVSDIADKVEIAGPGFINLHLSAAWLSQQLASVQQSDNLTVTPVGEGKIAVVDHSSPNLAKEMHVGHLRSTIIGDAVSRTLAFRGYHVIRQNHMGDWGTQFGMLIAHLSDQLSANQVAETALADLEDFYRAAKVRFDEEEGFADRAREYVVKLQGGDEQCLTLWKQFIDVSIQHSEEIYTKLNVGLAREDIMGESAYNDRLDGVMAQLKEKELVVEDNGAWVSFIQELADKKGNPSPFIVQKSGGGYLYSTTDLAAAIYRSFELNADRIIIFTDARQVLHFRQVECVARKAGFLREESTYEHCPFGTMMGSDGKPFKTRTGGTVKLADLLDEAVERAAELLAKRESDLSAEEQAEIARKVGIGAVKFADLSKHRTSDYIFNWDTMLSFDGATAPYLQYAFTRCVSVLRKAEVSREQVKEFAVTVQADQEKALAKKLLQFEDALDQLTDESVPHVLCGYLIELASLFMSFYEACPILKDGIDDATKQSRLALVGLVVSTLEVGLGLLGVETMERM